MKETLPVANFLLTLDPVAVEFGKLKELKSMSPGPGLDSGLVWSEVTVVAWETRDS